MTKEAFSKAICPSGDIIRGIREVFYETNPFVDNRNPTRAEVNKWHRIAINHVRKLVGYTSEDRQVKEDVCMFARSLWGQERKFTRIWDSKYPGTLGTAYGPCLNPEDPNDPNYDPNYTLSNSHCGATFIPDTADQAPYLPEGHPACTKTPGAEGISSAPKSNIPWSIKWSRAICHFIGSEGFWGGHVGPFFHREKFGFSFWDNDPANGNNNAILRGKWTGTLMPNLYCNPSDAGCDPDNTGPSVTK